MHVAASIGARTAALDQAGVAFFFRVIVPSQFFPVIDVGTQLVLDRIRSAEEPFSLSNELTD